MKLLVNMVQLVVIAAIIIPVLTIWETDKIDKLCQQIEPGMSQDAYLELVEEYSVNLTEVVGEEIPGGQWHAVAKTHMPWSEYQCLTKGVSKLVVTADIIKSVEESNDDTEFTTD
jgi:hypothetical protein